MEKIEGLYKPELTDTIRFGISVPRATYITHAFTSFVNELDPAKRISIDFRETNSMDAISNVCDSTSNLSVIRYNMDNEEYFMSLLSEKNLRHEIILKFNYRLILSADNPLAKSDDISESELSEYIEIIHGDYEIPYISSGYIRKMTAELFTGEYTYMSVEASLTCSLMWTTPLCGSPPCPRTR